MMPSSVNHYATESGTCAVSGRRWPCATWLKAHPNEEHLPMNEPVPYWAQSDKLCEHINDLGYTQVVLRSEYDRRVAELEQLAFIKIEENGFTFGGPSFRNVPAKIRIVELERQLEQVIAANTELHCERTQRQLAEHQLADAQVRVKELEKQVIHHREVWGRYGNRETYEKALEQAQASNAALRVLLKRTEEVIMYYESGEARSYEKYLDELLEDIQHALEKTGN